tara:strand:- start:11015 stop:11275 length:261 start_codon:yes stop_codon:yes gene_type:complete
MDINGTVTISLKDYRKLIEEHPKAEESRKNLYEASKEIEVFLSFICTREPIEDYVAEYNRQAIHSKIVIVNDKAKIQFNEKNNNKS